MNAAQILDELCEMSKTKAVLFEFDRDSSTFSTANQTNPSLLLRIVENSFRNSKTLNVTSIKHFELIISY